MIVIQLSYCQHFLYKIKKFNFQVDWNKGSMDYIESLPESISHHILNKNDNFLSSNEELNKICQELTGLSIEKRNEEKLIKLSKEQLTDYFNKQDNMMKLISDIQQDKPNFKPIIQIDTLQNNVLCVRAKLNNARIVRQQGCFLLFGIQDSKEMSAVMPSEWKREIDGQKIIIKNKQKIMQELKSFGISKQTLFPELESQAQEIMAQYKPK